MSKIVGLVFKEETKENKFVDEISEKSNNEEEIEETKENKNFKSKK